MRRVLPAERTCTDPLFDAPVINEPRDSDDPSFVLRTVSHALGPVRSELVTVVPRTVVVVTSRVDPLLAHLPPCDREGLFFTRDLPADVIFIGFDRGLRSSRYSIAVHPRAPEPTSTWYVADACLANKANHASDTRATCTMYVVDFKYWRRPVLMTKRPVKRGMRVTYEYRIPPEPCIVLPPS